MSKRSHYVLIMLTFQSGSTATMIRIRYIWQLNNRTDFLMVTTDIAKWSTIEPGIGITCAALACCRPVLRKIFSRSYLWGSLARNDSIGWPQRPPNNGSFRTGSKRIIDFGSLPKGNQNNNTVSGAGQHRRSDVDTELGYMARVHTNGSTGDLRSGSGWRTNDHKSVGNGSDDWPFESTTPRWEAIMVKTSTEISSLPARS
jgi:hypothetical protein